MRFVTYHPRALVGNGGVTATAWAWVSALADAGVDVAMIHGSAGGAASLDHRCPATAVRHRGRGALKAPVGLGALLEPGDLLVLHSGWVGYNLWAARVARRKGIPYMVVPQGAYEPNIRRRRRLLKSAWQKVERVMLEGAAAVHVSFESEKAYVLDMAPGAKCVVAPTGSPSVPTRWSGGRPALTWLGRYDIEHKGIDILLQSLALVPAAQRPRLHLRGRDSRHTRADVAALAASLGLSEWVEVGGPVEGDEKWEFLARGAGYVHPSRWECHSVTLLEALALGCPSLVSATTHIAPGLAATGSALVASPDPAEFALALMDFAARADDRLSARALAFVEEHLAWPAVTRQFLSQLPVPEMVA